LTNLLAQFEKIKNLVFPDISSKENSDTTTYFSDDVVENLIGEFVADAAKIESKIDEILNDLQKIDLHNQSLEKIQMNLMNKNIYRKTTTKYRNSIKKDLQMIFQDPSSSLNERMSVKDIIQEGLINFPDYVLTYKDDKEFGK
jgi:ABC-type antimicrobial peptide transport system ATPase subunit